MTKGELLEKLNSVPDDYEIRVVGVEGPHASIVNVITCDEEQRIALFLEFKEAKDNLARCWSDIRIEVINHGVR